MLNYKTRVLNKRIRYKNLVLHSRTRELYNKSMVLNNRTQELKNKTHVLRIKLAS